MDMDGSAFDAETYSQRLIKEASLSQLMAHESEVVRQIGALDSDMQTLVYENYNKFIAATDTIRKMRVDFRAMEDEMDRLADKMQNISVFSGQVCAVLCCRTTLGYIRLTLNCLRLLTRSLRRYRIAASASASSRALTRSSRSFSSCSSCRTA